MSWVEAAAAGELPGASVASDCTGTALARCLQRDARAAIRVNAGSIMPHDARNVADRPGPRVPEEGVTQDLPFTRVMTAAAHAELEALAHWLDLDRVRCE
jgi:hypothetical protein